MPTSNQSDSTERTSTGLADRGGVSSGGGSHGGAVFVGTSIDLPVLLSALRFGALVVCGLAAIVWLCGFVPEPLVGHATMGLAASLFAAVLALWLHGRFLDARAAAPYAGDGRLMAGRLQALLATAFGAKLAVLVLGMLVMRQTGVKFDAMAAFCVTFAAVSLVCQVAIASYLSRQLRHRPVTHRSAATSDRKP